MKKFMLWLISLLVIGTAVYIWWQYFYVFGSGVKSGHLNYVVLKGDVFKTYEGKMIQEGIRSKSVGNIQSYEFEFSVSNKAVAEKLMLNSGKLVDLHYLEYHGAVPWRGHTAYVVDSIISMREDTR